MHGKSNDLFSGIFANFFNIDKPKVDTWVIEVAGQRSTILPGEYHSERNARLACEIINMTPTTELVEIFGHGSCRLNPVKTQTKA
ncbi:hypothetical protein AVT69_gp192 [Pseudomonas phage PhiPA3]|uniref:Uncharacterized protein 194 n=1 Tax=Pseudomonas phage PhiPA3 TaxID=998086 RepID=F8SJM0_BPPA3|nr:hypothetical protein AVT69_gp192 [Pseudomonas phage PhiPA3]AEH03617.1 hypothetical protein [Pseudomonas phage PhiPA3]